MICPIAFERDHAVVFNSIDDARVLKCHVLIDDTCWLLSIIRQCVEGSFRGKLTSYCGRGPSPIPIVRMIKDSPFQSRYDAPTIWLHWLTAVLVVCQWIGAKTIDYWPRGHLRVDARSVHITFGLVLVLVFTARIAWRLGPTRKLPAAESGFWGTVARTMHWLLYALIASTLLLGLSLMTIRGDSYFGLFALPSFGAAAFQLRPVIAELHDLCATTLLIVAGLHASAGVVHPYIFGSNVLSRMWPRRAK